MSASADALLGAPLFIVGCPGSGTSVVGEILGAHGRIAYWSDPADIAPHYARLLRGEVTPGEARDFYLDACRRWLSSRSLSPIQRFAMRCPGHALVVPFLAREFPDAGVVHVIRDGRVMARSLVRSPVALPLVGRSLVGPLAGPPPVDSRIDSLAPDWVPAARRAEFEAATAAGRAALTWAIHVRAGLEGRVIAPDRYFEVRYEDLLADPGGWGGRVLAFAGVELNRAVERVLDRIRSEPYESRALEVGAEERALVEAKAADLLRELGYDVADAA